MIINDTTKKFYIGSAVNMIKRFTQHRDDLRKNKHDNSYLQRAWLKYGEADFRFVKLQLVEKENLVNLEQSWLNWTKCCERNVGYNLRPNANSNLGHKFSTEARANMAKAQLGKTHHRANILIAIKFNTGKQLSAERRTNISKGLTGRKFTEQHKLNMRLARMSYLNKRRLAQPIEGAAGNA